MSNTELKEVAKAITEHLQAKERAQSAAIAQIALIGKLLKEFWDVADTCECDALLSKLHFSDQMAYRYQSVFEVQESLRTIDPISAVRGFHLAEQVELSYQMSEERALRRESHEQESPEAQQLLNRIWNHPSSQLIGSTESKDGYSPGGEFQVVRISRSASGLCNLEAVAKNRNGIRTHRKTEAVAQADFSFQLFRITGCCVLSFHWLFGPTAPKFDDEFFRAAALQTAQHQAGRLGH